MCVCLHSNYIYSVMVHCVTHVFAGFFMYLEASQRVPDEEAQLGTPELTTGGPYCLQFYYHMEGLHLGKLEVSELRGADSDVPLDLDLLTSYLPDTSRTHLRTSARLTKIN